MAQIRRAETTWTGDLISGSGVVSAATSGAFGDLPVTWASRTEAADGRTSPEELVAAAHSACFSMAFSSALARNGFTPERLETSATITFEKLEAGWRLVASAIAVRGVVPGIDADRFRELAEGARDGCPISQALKGNVALSVDARLAD